MPQLNQNGLFLHGAVFDEHYPDGVLKECTLTERNEIKTPLGMLIPQYQDDGVRKKFTPSLCFYESGALRKIALQNQTTVHTPAGDLPVELITFYESGAVLRVFSLNGKISGYWTEQNEYGLSKPMQFDFPFGQITGRVIGIHFYESGAIKSLTFWPREKLFVQTPCGEVMVRFGISLYENGQIKSVEPQRPVSVCTPIGTLTAFDVDAVGISGDKNSLGFDQNDRVSEIKTISHAVRVAQNGQNVGTFKPCYTRSHFSDHQMAVLPLVITFSEDTVFFGEDQKNGYAISDTTFEIVAFDGKIGGNVCDGC